MSAIIACNELGDRAAAGKWVERGRQMSRVACGTDSREFKTYSEFHQVHQSEAAEAALAATLAMRVPMRSRGRRN